MNDEVKAFKLLRSLPQIPETLLQTLMYSKDKLVFDDVQSTLLSEDIRKMSKGPRKSSSSSSALIVERGRGREMSRREKNRSKNRPRFRSKSRDGDNKKGAIICWGCGHEGHIKKDCPKEKKLDGRKDKGKASFSTHVVIVEDDDHIL